MTLINNKEDFEVEKFYCDRTKRVLSATKSLKLRKESGYIHMPRAQRRMSISRDMRTDIHATTHIYKLAIEEQGQRMPGGYTLLLVNHAQIYPH